MLTGIDEAVQQFVGAFQGEPRRGPYLRASAVQELGRPDPLVLHPGGVLAGGQERTVVVEGVGVQRGTGGVAEHGAAGVGEPCDLDPVLRLTGPVLAGPEELRRGTNTGRLGR
nr:hypothetical protein [Streptomyces sp. NBRC 110465]